MRHQPRPGLAKAAMLAALVAVATLLLSTCLLPMDEASYNLRQAVKTDELKNPSFTRPPVADDEGNLYFWEDYSSIFRWSYSDGIEEVAELYQYYDSVAFDTVRDVLLFASGSGIYEVDLETGLETRKYWDPDNDDVEQICFLGTHLLIQTNSSSWDDDPKNKLVSLSDTYDYAVVDSVSGGDQVLAVASAYSAELDRRFWMDWQGAGYQDIDLVAPSLSSAVGVHSVESFSDPVLGLWPDGSAVAASTGDVWTTSDEMTLIGTIPEFDAIVGVDDTIYLLVEDTPEVESEYSCQLVAIDAGSLEEVGAPVPFEQQQSFAIFTYEHFLLVVTQDESSTYVTRIDIDLL